MASRRWAALAVALVGCLACSDAGSQGDRVRPPIFAQQGWYPSRAEELKRTVDEMLAAAPAGQPAGRLYALISPHAGIQFSGRVAACGYRLVEPDRFDRVLVIGLAHRVLIRGAAVSSLDAYSTPLGVVPLDVDACRKLRENRLFVESQAVDATEHSIELQLPFLQRRLAAFRLIPVAMGDASEADLDAMAAALTGILSPRTLVVVSTDFTHYGEKFDYEPFDADVQNNLARLDQRAFDLIVAKDAAGFTKFLRETRDTICGRRGVEVLLRMLPPAATGRLVKYDTSGRMLNDWRNSVSYGAVAFSVPESGSEGPSSAQGLTARERADLLRLARAAVETWVKERREPDPDKLGIAMTPALRRNRGAFVTLKQRGDLRGCIGYIEPREPLVRTVIENAKNASTSDPRFPPVRPADLPELSIEVSALTEPAEVDSPEGFVVGRHGIIIRKDGRSAVFLPQVAPEQGWDRATTLAHLCRKAGLPADEWRNPGMKFLVFEAEVFHEDEAMGAAAPR